NLQTGVFWVGFSPDGSRLVARTGEGSGLIFGSRTEALRVWDVPTRKEQYRLDPGEVEGRFSSSPSCAFASWDNLLTLDSLLLTQRSLGDGKPIESQHLVRAREVMGLWASPDAKAFFLVDAIGGGFLDPDPYEAR